jgi:hypothetical protein
MIMVSYKDITSKVSNLYDFGSRCDVLRQLRPVDTLPEHWGIVVLVSDVHSDLSRAWQGCHWTDLTGFYLHTTAYDSNINI